VVSGPMYSLHQCWLCFAAAAEQSPNDPNMQPAVE
jgi:hypothetical protein